MLVLVMSFAYPLLAVPPPGLTSSEEQVWVPDPAPI